MWMNRWVLIGCSVVASVLMFWISYQAGFESGSFPRRENLTCSSVRVVGVDHERYGALVHASPESRFFYRKTSGDFDAVVSALQSAKADSITFCFTPNTGSYGEPRDPDIFEIRAGGRTIRSLEEIRESWKHDLRWLWFLIPLLSLGGSYLAFAAGKIQSRTTSGPGRDSAV